MNLLEVSTSNNTKIFTQNTDNKQKQPVNKQYKEDIMDVFAKKVVNQNDLNDMVTVPRTIFKGYLCFTVGTAINAIGAMFKNPVITKPLAIFGSLVSIYGTYNFVKPFLIRESEKNKEKID